MIVGYILWSIFHWSRRSQNLPNNTENGIQYTVRELCAAAEKTSGYNSIISAQKIGGLPIHLQDWNWMFFMCFPPG